jgi:alanine racemase
MWQVDDADRRPSAATMPVYLKLNTGMNRLGFNADEFGTRSIGWCRGGLPRFGHADDAFRRCRRARGIAGQMAALSRHDRRPRSCRPRWRIRRRCCAFPKPWRLGAPGHHALRFLAVPRHDAASSACAGDDAGKRTDRGARTRPAIPWAMAAALSPSKPMRVGIVACGYADGYPRHAPTGTPVIGRRATHAHAGPRLDGQDLHRS